MDYNKALEILKLNPKFTEEELKENYKRLIKKYHPDSYNESKIITQLEMEKKASEINEAYTFLSRRLRKNRVKELKYLDKLKKKSIYLINETFKNECVYDDEIFVYHFKLERNFVEKVKESLNNINNIEEASYLFSKLGSDIKANNYSMFTMLLKKSKLDNIGDLSRYYAQIEKANNVNEVYIIYEKILNLFMTFKYKIEQDSIKLNKLKNKIEKYENRFFFDLTIEASIRRLEELKGTEEFDESYKKIDEKLTREIIERELSNLNLNEIKNDLFFKYSYEVSKYDAKGELNKIRLETNKLNKILEIIELINQKQITLNGIRTFKQLDKESFSSNDGTINILLYGKELDYCRVFLDCTSSTIFTSYLKVANIEEENLEYLSSDNNDKHSANINLFKKTYISLLDVLEESSYVGRKIKLKIAELKNYENLILLYQTTDFLVLFEAEYNTFMVIKNILDFNDLYELGDKLILENDLTNKWEIYKKILTQSSSTCHYKSKSL